MKLYLLTSAVLFSAGAYAQNDLVATTDSMMSYNLKEVVVSNASPEVILGELNAKSKKGQSITATSRQAYYFENGLKDENTYLKTMLFKVQKVKHATKAYIRLYKKRDYVQDSYHPETSEKSSYDSFIPGEPIATPDIVVYLEPGQKGIVEIDLSQYKIEMPAEGLFLSLEGNGYFDADGKEIEGLKGKELTWIDFHPTTLDNYCDWLNPIGTQSWFWVNTNKWLKQDYKEVLKSNVPAKALKAPNFGLKVERR